MQTCNESIGWLSTVETGQIITWLIVIFGWFIINRQHNKREDRKESREIIESIKEKLYALEQQSISYHTQENPKISLSEAIKLDIQRVIYSIKINNLIVNKKERRLLFKSLRKAITYKNFDTSKHISLEENSDVVYSIHEAVDDLIEKIEASFRSNYPFL